MVDFLVATGLALIFLALSWAFGRAVSGGRQLDPFKRKLLFYSFVFVLGEAYIMMVASHLYWLKELLFPVIGAWGAMLALVAWLQHRYQRAHHTTENKPPEPGR